MPSPSVQKPTEKDSVLIRGSEGVACARVCISVLSGIGGEAVSPLSLTFVSSDNNLFFLFNK